MEIIMARNDNDVSNEIVDGIDSASDGLSMVAALVAATIIGAVFWVIWKYETKYIRPLKTKIGLWLK